MTLNPKAAHRPENRNNHSITKASAAIVSAFLFFILLAKLNTISRLALALDWSFLEVVEFTWTKPVVGQLYRGEELLLADAVSDAVLLALSSAFTGAVSLFSRPRD